MAHIHHADTGISSLADDIRGGLLYRPSEHEEVVLGPAIDRTLFASAVL